MKQLRGALTPDEFASRIGVHPRSIYKFETGERVPSAPVLCAIADFTDADLEDLVRLAAGVRKPTKKARRRSKGRAA